ncbi:mechanosensitive ion channel family protein [Roseomonas marmotae]|uniref:Mechanosensitive ion channel n=1 Tax=Roseomonas marmotae TaxID=2768161 RepID=A0ABS3K924_9PROT|nr:mechanosensitive ion channel domain-containing protein [Roseomonas marmotae]MBO1073961.1 mechanosensitive ion channel [Roseomonas marmotae]QTI78755.1 mechanosensitive ion channel [Roseomonas marmotae]
MPGLFRTLSVPLLLVFSLLAGGLVPPALAQPDPAPAAPAVPAPAPAHTTPDTLAALDALLATLRNDSSRAAFVAELEQLRAGLAARGPAATPADAPAPAGTAADGAVPAGGTAPAAPATDEAKPEVPPEGGLLGAVAVGLTDVGQTVREQVTSGSIPARMQAAVTQARSRLDTAFSSGAVGGFLVWAATGWGLALLLLYGLRMLPWLRPLPRGFRFHPSRRAHLWRNAGLDAIRRLVPWLPAAAVILAWPALMPRSGDSARLLLAVAIPFLVGSLVMRLGGPLLFLLGPVRGWHIVSYAERRVLPWLGALATLSTASTMLRAPELRWTLGWDVAAILTFLIDLTLGIVAILFIIRHRRGVQHLLSHTRQAQAPDAKLHKVVGHHLATKWYLLGLLIVVGHLISRLLGVGGGSFIGRTMITLAAIAVIMAVTYAMSGGLARLAAAMQGGRSSLARRLTWRYLGLARQSLRFVATVVILVVALRIWGFDLLLWFGSGIGLAIIRPIFSIAMVLMVGWLIWITLDSVVDYALLPKENTGRARDHSTRARTLLPLLRNFAFVLLIVLTIIAVLSNLGLNVTPLLAGVSVFGLALSFGSQQLVQDVITGLFMLFEDTIAVGDTIDTGDRNGTVESVTIRTVRIRDGDGALHTIPFSQIKALKNRSRGLGVYTVKVVVGYDANLDRVMEVMREVGQSLRDDPAFSADMLTGLEIWGVDQFTPEGITIMGGLKTRALKQWGVGRAFNLRLKQRFDKEGIALTPPRPSLVLPPQTLKEMEADIGA